MSGPPDHVVSCPQCGGTTRNPFAAGGVCLRCAAERVLLGDDFSLPPPLEHPGRVRPDYIERIGVYEIIDEIGRGGMACVYAARQAGLGRIVALKALPEGRGGVAGLEMRFLREAQTVARLRHPHIVGVHDFGRADGQVYFTMDYLEDGDLAHLLRQESLTPARAAELLLKVAGALAYTHGEGVLHRDLKPSNILLDGGEPRLADFGLAAQLEPGGDLTAVTGVLGTPHYVAPEALRDGSGALSASSDIYALGVILYEMLTGRTPYAGASPAELPSLIERRDPPSPRLLAPAVPRDLQTVCLKCLERDPARRYPSAVALAEDLRRFLAGEPILARTPGAVDGFIKYARRHRIAFASGVSLALILIVATIVSTSAAVRATRAEKTAAAEARANKALADFLQKDLLEQASPNNQPDRDIKLRTVLDRTGQKIDNRFPDDPELEAGIRETLAGTYNSLGDSATEEKHLRRVLELRTGTLGPDHLSTLSTATALASSLAAQGKNEEAGRIGSTTCARLLRTAGPDHVATIHAFNNQIYVDRALGRLAVAESLGRITLARARRSLPPEHEEIRVALTNLSSILWVEGQLAEAETLNLEAVAAFQHTVGPEHPETLSVMSNLASVYWSGGKYAEAEKINRSILDVRRRLLGPEHPETLRSMNNLASDCNAAGNFEEAAALQLQTLEIRRRLFGPEHPDVLSSLHNLSQTRFFQNRTAEAIELCRQGHDIARRVLGPEHFLTLTLCDSLASYYFQSDQMEEGERLANTNLETYRRLSGPNGAKTIAAMETLATGWVLGGKFAAAEPMWRQAVAYRMKSTPTHWRTFSAKSQLGQALAGQHHYAEAEPLLVEACTELLRLKTHIPSNQRSVVARSGAQLIKLYSDWGKPAEAAAWRAKFAVTATPVKP